MNEPMLANAKHLPGEPRFPMLERVTALVLIVVLAALAWILVAAYQPDRPWFVATESQVVILLGLLTAALLLVSVVALLHTRL